MSFHPICTYGKEPFKPLALSDRGNDVHNQRLRDTAHDCAESNRSMSSADVDEARPFFSLVLSRPDSHCKCSPLLRLLPPEQTRHLLYPPSRTRIGAACSRVHTSALDTRAPARWISRSSGQLGSIHVVNQTYVWWWLLPYDYNCDAGSRSGRNSSPRAGCGSDRTTGFNECRSRCLVASSLRHTVTQLSGY